MSASEHKLYLQLQLAAHHVKKRADRALLQSTGITTAQAAVLAQLANGRTATQRAVAESLGQNESAVTAMVKRLIALGYLTRAKDETDARAWQLAITTEGQSALDSIAAPFADINATFDRALSEGEIAALADYLQRITRQFSGT